MPLSSLTFVKRLLPLALAAGLLFQASPLPAQPARIAAPIDAGQVVELRGNVPSKAQPQNDQGPVDPSLPLQSITLLLKPSATQQVSLTQMLAAQQDRSSPDYHRWLTSDQFGDRFGLSPGDVGKIQAWLQSEGFQVRYTARARNWIVFSGSAGQVARVFRTEIHRYLVDGETHFANATDPFVPAALAGVAGAIRGLDDFRLEPLGHPRAASMKPAYTNLSGTHYLAPGDLATIYDLTPLYTLGINGAGQNLVVVGQTDINLADIAAYRNIFSLPPNPPVQLLVPYSKDPGTTSDLSEAEMDLELSGAVALDAQITYVYSTDILTSVLYALDQNPIIAPIISMSYGGCEAGDLGVLDSYRTAAQQANALGVTWVASSGDAGAAACDVNTKKPPTQATQGLAVEFPASIPEVTAVGGTEFILNDGGYWSYFNGNNQGSAQFYIPEMSWNDSIDGTGLRNDLSASGGGVSMHYPAPPWQIGSGFPSGGACSNPPCRLVPDVALAASADHDGYVICYAGLLTSCPTATVWLLQLFAVEGGTSASAPVFAGMLTLLNHYLVSTGIQPQAGLGNVNPTLYWLAQHNGSVFHDITSGSNIVPCQTGTTNCPSGSLGYSAGPGYDEVTGLGSVDAYYLATSWPGASTPQIASITPQTPTAGSQTQAVTVFGSGFQANLTVAVTSPSNGTTTLQGSGQLQNVTPASFQMTLALNASGTWGIQVNDPDGISSNQFEFMVGASAALPDLVVTAFTGPNAAVAGGTIDISSTVLNQGNASAGAFQLEFYFSPASNPSLSTAVDTNWGCAISGLSAGGTYTCAGPIAVPASLSPGTWYLAAFADANSQVSESNENNNWRVADTGPVNVTAMTAILGAGADGNLYSIVPTTGATVLIGPLPTVMSDIAAYNTSLYAISLAETGESSVLYTIDPSSGAGTAIGYTGPTLNALVFSPSGTLYAAGGDSLYTLNTSTGQATLIGSGSGSGTYSSSGDLAFDSRGVLYLTSTGSSGDQLFSINPATGQGAPIGNIGYSQVYGLSYYNGTAYGFTSGGTVLNVNLSTGLGASIATYSPGFDGTTVYAPAAASVPSDFNHDGHPDVIWEDPTSGFAQIWYLGGGLGVSVTGAADLTQTNPWHIVAVADFNGDGNPDVVWQDPVSGAVQVWFLGGSGGNELQSAANITTHNAWKVVSVADFNQDGHPDLLWQDPTSGFSQIWYLGGPQGITLLGAADLDQTNPWRIVGTGDFNGDGVPDVLWQDPVSGTVQVWYMGGTASGQQGSQLQSAANLGANSWHVVAVADFNQDGHPDLVFESPSTNAAQVFFYTGAQGTTPAGNAVLSGPNPWYIAGPH